MKTALTRTLALSFFAFLLSCDAPTNSDRASAEYAVPQASHVPAAARHELAGARAATAKYHDVDRAIADGYVDIGLNVPGQGMHFLKESLLDGVFDAEKPELLLYVERGNRLELVGVEYAVPTSLSESAPAGFSGDADSWHVEEDFGLWVLHAWIWLGNPDGIFANTNPNVS